MNFKLILCSLLFVTALSAVESEYLEYDELESMLDYYSANPLNINRATPSDIYGLPYIDEITAENIFYRIKDSGEISSLQTLVDENILDQNYASHLSSCVVYDYVSKTVEKGEYSGRFNRRLERSRGYDEAKYLGNPSQFAHKLKFSSRELAVSALIEKDPGEANYSDNMKGNIVYTKINIYRILLGHFSLSSYTGMLQKEGFTFDQYAFSNSSNFHDLTRTAPSTIDYFGYNGTSAYYQTENHRIFAFYGRKYISATLNDKDEIKTVNLYAYTRTINEINRYHNAYHEAAGGGVEGKNSVLNYAFSVSGESFSRELDAASALTQGTLGEISLSVNPGEWMLKSDAATDFDRINLKLNAQMRSKNFTSDFFYGYIQKDKFSLTSPGMMFGSGEEEQAFGAKFKAKPFKNALFISENIIYFSKHSGANLPCAVFSLKTNISTKNTTVEPSFRYKAKESTDRNFISSEDREYLTRLKLMHKIKSVSVSADIRYADNSDGGYGYLFGSALNYRGKFFRLRIGGDIYYSKNGAILYTSYADTGKYPGLYSFSGLGRKTYIMSGFTTGRYELIAGISRHKIEDGEIFGSGNDMIYSDTVHTAEVNFRIKF